MRKFLLKVEDYVKLIDNQEGYRLFNECVKNEAFLTLVLKTSKNAEAYIWITAFLKGIGTIEFKLSVSQAILDEVMYYIFSGKKLSSEVINPNEGLEEFSKSCSNFALDFFKEEEATGKQMHRTFLTRGLKISSFYKKGVIVYEVNKNQELKSYIELA